MKKIIFLSFLSFVLSVCPAFSMEESGTESDRTTDGGSLFLGLRPQQTREASDRPLERERAQHLLGVVKEWFETDMLRAVESIDWSGSNLDARDMAILAPALRKMVNVKVIRVGTNLFFGDAGAMILADNLAFHGNLEHLNLRGTGLTDEGAAYVLRRLTRYPYLKSLNFYGNQLTDRMVAPLCEFIPSCEEFVALNMGGNRAYIREGDPIGDVRVFRFLQDQGYNIAHPITCQMMIQPGKIIVQPPCYAERDRLSPEKLFEIYGSELR